MTHPELLESNEFPSDAKKRAKAILDGCRYEMTLSSFVLNVSCLTFLNRGSSVGSYSDSAGVEVIRRHAAEYISRRDGGIESNWDDIILSAGASESIRVRNPHSIYVYPKPIPSLN